MIKVREVLVSDEAVAARFQCDVGACLGACCRVGDVGAVLGLGEQQAIAALLERVRPLLPQENLDRIDSSGWFERFQKTGERLPIPGGSERDRQESSTSPAKDFLACFPDGRCVFSTARIAGGKQALGCALEAAFLQGLTTFRKPLFCHLFPLRLGWFYGQTVLNAERRPECEPGWGAAIGLLESSREALVRLFGKPWYDELLAALPDERARLNRS